jgi:sugar phosphate isomerase/epimerase
MRSHSPLSRRSFLASAALVPLAGAVARKKPLPIGLELYSVRTELSKDLPRAVRAVAGQGYQVVEFYGPYYSWTLSQAKETRKLLDDLGIRCNSTHNDLSNLSAEGLPKAIELNQALGSRYIVVASAGRVDGLDGWRKVADTLTQAADKLRPLNLRTGYHNHAYEFVAVAGRRPIELIAAGTPPDVMLQLDVGTCVEAGQDPVAWIKANPGRINCIHCKDWAPGAGKGYEVLFGEGVAPWRKIFQAAESRGGVEWYLIEQEGARMPELEASQRCLANWKRLKR